MTADIKQKKKKKREEKAAAVTLLSTNVLEVFQLRSRSARHDNRTRAGDRF